MRHLINGCPIDLRSLSDARLAELISENHARRVRLDEEHESLVGELIRRGNTNVVPLQRADTTPQPLDVA